ncbi:MAG: hypothetical protein KQJ78_19175 [Deltaproteobacteria bacterium]|nr:hypothetical protein [Deltaproteobacteria bacterium]
MGNESDGFHILRKPPDFTRLGGAVQALGIARGAWDYAAAQAQERHQFGQAILNNQRPNGKLVDLVAPTEAARQTPRQTRATRPLPD